MSEKQNISLVADGDEISMTGLPVVDRDFTPPESFLAAVFTIWIAGGEGDKRALELVDRLLTVATELLGEPNEKAN